MKKNFLYNNHVGQIIKFILIFTVINIGTAFALTPEDVNRKLDKFEKRIEKELSDKENNLKEKIDMFKKAYDTILTIFLIVTSLGSILSIYFIIDAKRRENHFKKNSAAEYEDKLKDLELRHQDQMQKLAKQLEFTSQESAQKLDKYEKFIENLEKRNASILESAQGNISQTTDLLKTLDSIFRLRKEVDKFEEDIKQINDERENVHIRVIGEINSEAIDICMGFNRSNYSSNENQMRFHEFYLKFFPRIKEYNLDDNGDALNANCYLILALNFKTRNQSDPIPLIKRAIEKALTYSNQDAPSNLYPGKSPAEIKNWNKKLANICEYHAGILHYNLGEYSKAIECFKKAIAHDKNDIKSMLYIPEAKFLGALVDDFNILVNEFDELQKKIDQITDTSNWSEKKDALLSQLYVRYGNCFFAKSKHKQFNKFRSLKHSIEKYTKAYEYTPNSYIAQFSLAQSMHAKAHHKMTNSVEIDEFKRRSQKLFKNVFYKVREKIADTSEAKILMMLYYILAVACRNGNIEGENYTQYLLPIYREVSNLTMKNRIRIFSPLTKNDLTCGDFIYEVRQFEDQLI